MSPSPKRSPFARAFYVANTMEIFERLAWYGFFTLSSLYITSPVSQGGLGFSDKERGFLQGMIPFFLYLFPVVTGGLADRFGYKKMFMVSFLIMSPAYYLLGVMHQFWSFFFVFLAVAVGAACFKPVVVGTIGKTTDDSNRGLGFGIFYTMVNIGGFLGPFVAGYVRAISWDMVFIMSAVWIALNFIPLLAFYQEPVTPTPTTHQDGDKAAPISLWIEAQEVLGNARFALMVVPAIIGLMVFVKAEWHLAWYLLGLVIVIVLNVIWSWFLGRKTQSVARWYTEPVRIGNVPFVLYLLILTGFWTVYFQFFTTLPIYIRDFVDTQGLVQALHQIAPQSVDFFANVSIDQLSSQLPHWAQRYQLDGTVATLKDIHFELVNYKVRVPETELLAGLQQLQQGQVSATNLAQQWAQAHRQINPEYIINIGFGMIVVFQIAVSYFLQRLASLPTLVGGTLALSIGIVLCGLSAGQFFGLSSGVLLLLGVATFTTGEMLASPKSQEYVAAIAPANKTAMYMGYYFVSMALGNLCSGLLSGWAYGAIAKQGGQPQAMWLLFGAIGAVSALGFVALNTWLKRHR